LRRTGLPGFAKSIRRRRRQERRRALRAERPRPRAQGAGGADLPIRSRAAQPGGGHRRLPGAARPLIQNSMIRWILISLVVLAAAGGWWYTRSQGPEALRYDTAEVTRGDLTQVVTATGILNPVLNVQVGSQISGNIQKLFADFNSSVQQGQVVAQL